MKSLLILFFLFSFQNTFSQIEIGLLPQLTKKFKLGPEFNYTLKTEMLAPVYTNNEWGVKFRRVDLQNFFQYKLTSFSKADLGYQIRLNDQNQYIHRTIQQYSTSKNSENVIIGHRARTDQTFTQHAPVGYRIRYRFSTQIPLNGFSLNEKESYLVISDEVMGKFAKDFEDFENRIGVSIGKLLTNSNKLEAGMDYRTGGFLIREFDQKLYFSLSYVLN